MKKKVKTIAAIMRACANDRNGRGAQNAFRGCLAVWVSQGKPSDSDPRGVGGGGKRKGYPTVGDRSIAASTAAVLVPFPPSPPARVLEQQGGARVIRSGGPADRSRRHRDERVARCCVGGWRMFGNRWGRAKMT